jgi:hypothetical protein
MSSNHEILQLPKLKLSPMTQKQSKQKKLLQADVMLQDKLSTNCNEDTQIKFPKKGNNTLGLTGRS